VGAAALHWTAFAKGSRKGREDSRFKIESQKETIGGKAAIKKLAEREEGNLLRATQKTVRDSKRRRRIKRNLTEGRKGGSSLLREKKAEEPKTTNWGKNHENGG